MYGNGLAIGAALIIIIPEGINELIAAHSKKGSKDEPVSLKGGPENYLAFVFR